MKLHWVTKVVIFGAVLSLAALICQSLFTWGAYQTETIDTQPLDDGKLIIGIVLEALRLTPTIFALIGLAFIVETVSRIAQHFPGALDHD